MENDLSLILLIFAGIVLLLLFIYSFRTRVKQDDLKLLESDEFNHVETDEKDILTRPAKNKEKIIPSAKDEEFTQLLENSFINTKNNKNKYDDYLDIIDDSNSTGTQVEPKLTKKHIMEEEDVLVTQPDRILTATPKINNVGNFNLPLKPAIIIDSEPKLKETTVNFLPSTLLTLHVMPQEEEKFVGYDLLQALLAAKLRFGKMSIFHRYQYPNEQGKILFSTAQVTEPGTFSMDKMGACQCSGLVLFMQLLDAEHNLETMELFIQTAQQLADNLDGLLMTKPGQAFTPEIKKQFALSVRHHLDKIGIVG